MRIWVSAIRWKVVVELPVSAAWEAVPGVVGGGDLDGGNAGVAGERRCGREPAGSPGAAEQLSGDDRSDPVDLAEPAPGRFDGLLDLGGQAGLPKMMGTRSAE